MRFVGVNCLYVKNGLSEKNNTSIANMAIAILERETFIQIRPEQPCLFWVQRTED
jgi:hypothetical protein